MTMVLRILFGLLSIGLVINFLPAILLSVGNIHQTPTQEDIPVEVVSHGYRNNRSSTTPEELLLDAVRTNDLQEIKTLIKKNKRLLSFEYPYPYFGRILYVACSEPKISPDTIEVLLQLGAKPFDERKGLGEIIHVVARSTNSAILQVIVKYLKEEEINHTFRGNNALLLLVKEADYKEKRIEFLVCARILIESGINVNQADLENLTAVLWAIKKKYKDLIGVLLENRYLDIDNYTMNGKSARELINSDYPDLVIPNNCKSEIRPEDLLFSYLNSKNEDAFVNYNQGDLSKYIESDNYTHTLLQLSCKLGLLKAARHLLKNKADVRKKTKIEKLLPLDLAAENGHFKIVDLLLEHDGRLRAASSTLCFFLNKMNLSETDDEYKKYYTNYMQLLNTQDKFSINSSSIRFQQQTPLHFAVKFAKPKHIIDLLRRGSSLANKDEFGIMAIENIEAVVFKQHLDECVDINDIDKNNVVILKYTTLLPFPLYDEGFFRPETDAFLYISKAPHLKQLLTHPVIDTFLLVTWYKMKKFFYTNLFFYSFFMASLLTYIFSSYGKFHYIPENDSSLLAIANTSHFILCLTYVILVMRECFQISVNPKEYHKDVDNWIEVILIFNVGFIIFISDPTKGTRKQLSSLAVLLSTFEFIILVGQHPRLTTYVVMFKTVSTNFIKFLAWYFLPIAAFAMSFFILFSESVEEKHEGKKEDKGGKDEKNNTFLNPGVALFKTLVMLTGEFDAGDLKFDSYPVTSKVIFILFVLMIALILLNLLNGLAVSDIQSIKNDAEYVGLIARTEHIHYMESMLLGNIPPSSPLNFLNKIFPSFSNHMSLYPATKREIRITNFESVELDEQRNASWKLDEKIQRKIRRMTRVKLNRKRMNRTKMHVEQSQTMISNESNIEHAKNEQADILNILQDINTKLNENLM